MRNEMKSINPQIAPSVILYQDQDILLINKIPGLLSVPDGYDPDLPYIKSVLEPLYGPLWIVHRLDKETSGGMVLARNEDAHHSLSDSFQNKQVREKYHGLVSPVPNWRENILTQPLQIDADRKHRTRFDIKNGKEARSNCKVLKTFPLGVLMEIEIHTGLTHQIRAHLRAEDLLLLGETLYNAGLPPLPLNSPRIMLHARTLAFAHPSAGKWQQFTAPYLEDFRDTYTKLRFAKGPDIVI
jgi:tRNA pseudouridine32 synthase / 23S rRNA pseudouridine746 synthase